MKQINKEDFQEFIEYAWACKQGKVYPLSITKGYQAGDIFVSCNDSCKAVLFWHYCGFAFISGEYDDKFLNEVYNILSANVNCRRFILLTDDNYVADFYQTKERIAIEKRYFYEYADKGCQDVILPEGCQLKVIDKNLLQSIKGRITPRFSWDNDEDFLTKGKGYCIICDGEIAGWAFTAAISNDEIDIGVESSEKFRGRGFATIVSKAMVNYCMEQGKAPVWACHSENTGSARLAEKVGFIKKEEGFVIKGAEE